MSTAVLPGDPPAPAAARVQSVALSRDLTEFLLELAIALNQRAIYPSGHPIAAVGAQRVNSRLLGLLTDRATLTFGVARRQLVIDGVLTDPDHPILHDLAVRFNRVEIGAVRIEQGAGRSDLAALLDWVAAHDDRTATSGAAMPWSPLDSDRITLFRHSYERLDLAAVEADGAAGDAGAAQSGALWVGLAQAALAGSGAVDAPLRADPVIVARAIDGHSREAAYDQVIVGYLSQIADEVRTADDAEAHALQRRVSRLVRALDAQTLQQLLAMGGSTTQRQQFAMSAAEAFSADALLDVVKAAAAAGGQTISHSLVRVLSKLADHAESAPAGGARTAADRALRENVRRLIESWQLPDPNPDGYRGALEAMALDRVAGETHTADPAGAIDGAERVLAMCLELDVGGPPLARVVGVLVAAGRVERVIALLAGPPPGERAAAEAWAALADGARLRRLAADSAVAPAFVQRIAERAGRPAVAPLLDELAETENRKTRARLLELLPALGHLLAPDLSERLAVGPWYVQRNLLAVIARLETLPDSFSPTEWLGHDDIRVRREAVRVALRHAECREAAVAAAIRDGEERTVQLALGVAEAHGSRRMAALLRRAVDTGTVAATLRPLAVRVAAASREPATLSWLLRMVAAERRWLGRARLARKAPEQLAALAALRAHWAAHPDASAVLALALASPDAELRAAAAVPSASSHE